MTRIRVHEGDSYTHEFDIEHADFDGSPTPTLTAATLTLVDLGTFAGLDASPLAGIINTRNGQDVLNANDVTIDGNGHVTWAMQPEDNPIMENRRQVERHRAEFAFAWDGGAYAYEMEIEVVNLRTLA